MAIDRRAVWGDLKKLTVPQKEEVELAETAISALLKINKKVKIQLECLVDPRVEKELWDRFTRSGWLVGFSGDEGKLTIEVTNPFEDEFLIFKMENE